MFSKESSSFVGRTGILANIYLVYRPTKSSHIKANFDFRDM